MRPWSAWSMIYGVATATLGADGRVQTADALGTRDVARKEAEARGRVPRGEGRGVERRENKRSVVRCFGSTEEGGRPQYRTVQTQYSTAQDGHSTAQYNHSTAQHRTATVPHSTTTVQHSTGRPRYRTVQPQYSTAQHNSTATRNPPTTLNRQTPSAALYSAHVRSYHGHDTLAAGLREAVSQTAPADGSSTDCRLRCFVRELMAADKTPARGKVQQPHKVPIRGWHRRASKRLNKVLRIRFCLQKTAVDASTHMVRKQPIHWHPLIQIPPKSPTNQSHPPIAWGLHGEKIILPAAAKLFSANP
ncbi:hypothetical protein BJ875DRAFT_186197 [Amylocarpus encephaloides]|uniref:Uncharacterized protein n=1 Tax=Amylocarpus encephaloides TaxID=45428 RepID=A0A9P7YAP9_9HELO|nr:hypothetical protein BJ875DRAFT_186197 [Amylocarpus encephaloides]